MWLTMEGLRGRESWTRSRATAQASVRGIATAVLLTFMMPSPGAANERVLKELLSEDAETAEKALEELWDALYGPTDIYGPDRPWTVDSVGAFFREDVDLAAWFGEVLESARPEVRVAVGWFIGLLIAQYPSPERIEFAGENHMPAEEMFEGWPGYIVDGVPTMEHLREDGGLLRKLGENVSDDEARRLALVFASQMRRVQEAIPELVEDEYDRRQRSGTIGGSDDMLGVLFSYLAFLQEQVGTEETRKVAWRTWAKERETRGFPAEVVGVEAPWNLFGMGIAHSELGESGFPLEGRALSPGVRRAALALTAEPALADRLAEGADGRLEAAVALLANERPLAEETGRRILDLYCGSLDGLCFEKLNLLYAGPDDPSLQSMEADVGGLVIESLVGLVEEAERQCGVLAALEAEVSLAAGGHSDPGQETRRDPGQETRRRIMSIGRELQDVLVLVGRLDSVPRPVLEGVFEFWSTERFPEARRILEENDWLEPDVAAVSSEQRDGVRPGLSPRRSIGTTELCEGRI